jgi:hypothetical protein
MGQRYIGAKQTTRQPTVAVCKVIDENDEVIG